MSAASGGMGICSDRRILREYLEWNEVLLSGHQELTGVLNLRHKQRSFNSVNLDSWSVP
jgi:hypothetical protein